MREYSPRRRTALVLTGSGTVRRVSRGRAQGPRRERREARPRRGLGRGRGGRGLRRGRGWLAPLRRARVLDRRELGRVLPLAPGRARRDPAPGLLVRRLPAARGAGPGRGPALPARADLRPRLARVGGPRGSGAPGRALGAARSLPGRSRPAHLLPVRGRPPRPAARSGSRSGAGSAESFEWLLDPSPARERLLDALWEIARGPAIRRARRRKRSWAASTFRSSPRTSDSPASAS